MKIYVDTCVYLNIFKEERKFNHYEFSFEFFKRLKQEDHTLLVSDWLENQIKIKGFIKEFNEFVATFPNVEKILVTDDIKEKGSKFTEREDAIHALIAIENHADVLVTRNFPDFLPFENQIKIELPEGF